MMTSASASVGEGVNDDFVALCNTEWRELNETYTQMRKSRVAPSVFDSNRATLLVYKHRSGHKKKTFAHR